MNVNEVTHTKTGAPRLLGGRLGCKIDDDWHFVFCLGRGVNGERKKLVTTRDRSKALRADALPYFRQYFPDLEFAIV